MRYEIRPLGPWLEPVTNPRRSSSTFRAKWADTLDLLQYETELLGAQLVVVQVDVGDTDIRRDGMLYANAKVEFPGVRVSFDSVHGPLTYSTDAYDRFYGHSLPGWQANVRAIALALEALRAVDRYGVSSRGEQYQGWTAIEATATVSDVSAAALLLDSNDPGRLIGAQPTVITAAWKAALRRNHPDTGDTTNPDMAAIGSKLKAARDLLLAGAAP
jgi:hypothetical protein